MGVVRLVIPACVTLATTLIVGVQIMSAAQPAPDEGEAEPAPPPPQTSTPSKHPKLATSIQQLVEAGRRMPAGLPMTDSTVSVVEPGAGAMMRAGFLSVDSRGRAQVYIYVQTVDQTVLNALGSRGVAAERSHESQGVIQARVAVKAIPRIAALESVAYIAPPRYGRVDVGSRLTQGDTLLGFDDLRSAAGVNGSGVTVGVISDGIGGLASAIAAGDLPASTLTRDVTGKLIAVTGGVIATYFRADGDLEGKLGSSSGSEGTAMMEIVHDIAPGAQLRFANFNTDLEFNAAVDFLASVSDVVIDDISFSGGPYDQSSLVSSNTATELQRLSNPIRGYYTSVGNSALSHYEEPFASGGGCLADGSTCHRFVGTSDTTDAFNLGAIVANPILVPAGGTGVVELTWDDTFGSATSDYDLYLIDELTLEIVSQGTDDNTTGKREPIEFVGVTNSTAAPLWFDIRIVNFLGTQPAHRMELFVFGTATLQNGTKLNFNTKRSSVTAQSDSGGGVVSVGAIAASDPGTDTIEPFSSHGPTNNGATKPDVTAIDGVSVTGSGGFPATFFGTSAAAPHVAGLAALLLDKRPDLLSGETGDDPAGDRAKLRAAIVDTAVDLGVAGVDNTYGSGRVDGLSAGQALDTDLSVAKSASPDPVVNGSDLTYVVTVSNNGPDNSTGVVLTDTLPQGVTFVTSTPGAPVCSESSATVTCNLGDLASGASTTVSILVSVNSATVITNTATVSGVEPDPELGNNTSTIATNVLAAPAVPLIPPWGMMVLALAFGLFIWLRGRSAPLAARGRPLQASASRSRLARRSLAGRP